MTEYRNPFQEILSAVPSELTPDHPDHPDHEAFLEYTYELCNGDTNLPFAEWFKQYQEDTES